MIDVDVDMKDFDAFIKTAKDDLVKATEGIMQVISSEMLHRIMKRTPVDTGRARAGWRLMKTGKMKFVISNEVHYIIYLEFGHSKQAPGGMVRITLQELKYLIESGWFMPF